MSGGVLGMVMAGGEGSRLRPLTHHRSKPSVPFGGSYRLIDFVLNNMVNANICRIYVLTQFKSQSLYQHLQQAWHLSGVTGQFIDPIPAQMRTGKDWYQGTADCIYQNLGFIDKVRPNQVCIFGSDHVYKMDISQMVDYHKAKKAVMTVAALRMPLSTASAFGVIQVDEKGQMIGFEEKPANPKPIPGDPDHALVSMGNYVFEYPTLRKELLDDAKKENSDHDFGHDIIPHLYPNEPVYVYDFSQQVIEGEKETTYWRDVGTIASYWQANMDLVETDAPFTLRNKNWPLHTYYPPIPPAKIVDKDGCRSRIVNSQVSAGCKVEASIIDHCILGFSCEINFCSTVTESVLLGDCIIGEKCVISRAIIDKDVEIAPGTIIGEDIEEDRKRFHVSDEGIVVIAKGQKVGF